MDLPTILVLGSNGQLGQSIKSLSSLHPAYNFVFMDRHGLDINDDTCTQAIVDMKPTIVINAAAYTAVDKAEVEVYEAMNANAYGVARVAKACRLCNAWLIHVSSDYVYHSVYGRPLSEADDTLPKNIYAISKLYGENFALYFNPKTIVVRSSWIYSIYGNNFVKTMLRLGATKNQLSIVSDQHGAPTNAIDLAAALLIISNTLVNHADESLQGIYNFANEGHTTWMDFAKAIFEIKGMAIDAQPTTTVAFNAPAPRPLWSIMDMTKIKSNFGLSIPEWRESLEKTLAVL
jgi:dTDP-4-dehydrorhamnose reductase